MILRTISVSLALAFLVAAGCSQGDPIATPCHDIPANGCPLADNDTDCSDPCCAAMYACTDGKFTLDHACAGFKGCDAGAPSIADASEPCDVSGIDAPPGASGGQGCGDLELPDCPLGVALGCGLNPCLICETFFVCESGGWVRWAECAPDGGGVTFDH
jgi:hypothetical protein